MRIPAALATDWGHAIVYGEAGVGAQKVKQNSTSPGVTPAIPAALYESL